jgi:peptidoglycan/LPS O-acetylase OafA/YrhL
MVEPTAYTLRVPAVAHHRRSHKEMRRVQVIAILYVAISVINILILTIVAGPQKLITRAIRFGITCFLSYHLAKGKNWARWTVAILSTLAGIVSLLVYPAMLKNLDQLPAWFVHWGLVMGLLYTIMAGYLFFSKTVKHECVGNNANNAGSANPLHASRSEDC